MTGPAGSGQGPRVTWSKGYANVGGGVVECRVMHVDGDSRAVVFPYEDGTWAAQEETSGTVVAVRPSLEEAQEAAVAWIGGLREISRVLRQARRGRESG